MAASSEFMIPLDISFEAAMELTQRLLDRWTEGTVTTALVETTVARLAASENGARGFFVVYLSDAELSLETTIDVVVAALSTAPETISSLLVKNLVMSTAMIISHRRNQREDLAVGSERVQARSLQLMQRLQTPELQAQVAALVDSLTNPAGVYANFLTRWNYDAEQRQAMQQILQQT